MKIAVVMTLLLVAFSAVALAEKSVERAALDLVIARGDCGWIFDSCENTQTAVKLTTGFAAKGFAKRSCGKRLLLRQDR
uniref:U24-Sparatoxin-Hju1aw_1 n=1 Tax=Heteropoda jugulans TaxID=1358901 RepID=A0A4Q8KCN1_9ARAC